MVSAARADEPAKPNFVSPAVPGYGPVVAMPEAEHQPTKGTKLVLDVTATAKEASEPPPGLVRAAVLKNLAAVAGLKPNELPVAIVLHGQVTELALTDGAYQDATESKHAHAALVDRLTAAGVEVYVCGQSLARKGLKPDHVRPGVKVAASAVSAVTNYQSRGYAYIPAH